MKNVTWSSHGKTQSTLLLAISLTQTSTLKPVGSSLSLKKYMYYKRHVFLSSKPKITFLIVQQKWHGIQRSVCLAFIKEKNEKQQNHNCNLQYSISEQVMVKTTHKTWLPQVTLPPKMLSVGNKHALLTVPNNHCVQVWYLRELEGYTQQLASVCPSKAEHFKDWCPNIFSSTHS